MNRPIYVLFACFIFWLLQLTRAEARTGEFIIQLAVPTDAAPDRVCVHADKLDPKLACLVVGKDHPERDDLRCDDKVEPKAHLGQFAKVPESVLPAACSIVEPRDKDYRSVCLNVGEHIPGEKFSEPGSIKRELHLQLHHARLQAMAVEPNRLVLKLEYADNDALAPRVESLGGAYSSGAIIAIRGADIAKLDLIPRCVQRSIRMRGSCAEGSPKEALVRHEAADAIGWVRVDPTGRHGSIRLECLGTSYEGTFGYPVPEVIELEPTKFKFRWTKSCFVDGTGTAQGCPTASLPGDGIDCHPDAKAECGVGQCCYQCASSRPVNFPAEVAFRLEVATGKEQERAPDIEQPVKVSARPRLMDELTWRDSLGYPGDVLDSFIEPERRRIFVGWEDVALAGKNGECPVSEAIPAPRAWNREGNEIDELEIVMPDGRRHQIRHDAARVYASQTTRNGECAFVTRELVSIPAPGVQCGDHLDFRYHGRYPQKTGGASLVGDTAIVDSPDQNRQEVIVGVRTHAGILYYRHTDPITQLTPAFDLELAALAAGVLDNFEVTLSGMLSRHPYAWSLEGTEEWSDVWQARVLIGGGLRKYLHTRVYADGGIGAGVSFPVHASDRDLHKEYFTLGVRARLGYEFRRQVALDILSVWVFPMERYTATALDAFGTASQTSERTLAFAVATGLQWADVF